MARISRSWPALGWLVVALAVAASAHKHHEADAIPDGQAISDKPIDTILWIHILFQMTSFGLLFPLGIVFGLTKSRWHVPTQVLASALAVVGFALGHMHRGRQFREHNAHAKFASVLNGALFAQVIMGIYLKLHLETGINGRIRRVIRPLHSLVGKMIPILSWTQMLLGGATALGFCYGDENAIQCIQHYSLGSALTGYATVMALFLLAGQSWLRRANRSQELFDGIIVTAWGLVNMVLGHHWGKEWTREDWQGATLGLVWLVAGFASMWLSYDSNGQPQRNFLPGFVIFLSGWGMSTEEHETVVSAEVAKVFSYTVMAAGLARVVEVAFVVKDKVSVSDDGRETNSWQYVPIFLLFSSGVLSLGSTKEQLQIVAQSGLGHVPYIYMLFALSMLFFLFVHILISFYIRLSAVAATPVAMAAGLDVTRGVQVQDAEEFELEGLITDDEDDVPQAAKPSRSEVSHEDGLLVIRPLVRNMSDRAPLPDKQYIGD